MADPLNGPTTSQASATSSMSSGVPELNHALPQAAPPPAQPIPQQRARALAGEHHIAMILRAGAVCAGLCFAASLCVELLPATEAQGFLIDLLRKAGVALLIVTPIARIVAAGVMLGLKGEWRYALFTGCILLLLAVAVGAGFSA